MTAPEPHTSPTAERDRDWKWDGTDKLDRIIEERGWDAVARAHAWYDEDGGEHDPPRRRGGGRPRAPRAPLRGVRRGAPRSRLNPTGAVRHGPAADPWTPVPDPAPVTTPSCPGVRCHRNRGGRPRPSTTRPPTALGFLVCATVVRREAFLSVGGSATRSGSCGCAAPGSRAPPVLAGTAPGGSVNLRPRTRAGPGRVALDAAGTGGRRPRPGVAAATTRPGTRHSDARGMPPERAAPPVPSFSRRTDPHARARDSRRQRNTVLARGRRDTPRGPRG